MQRCATKQKSVFRCRSTDIPNPTIGIDARNATIRNCSFVGSCGNGELVLLETDEIAVVVVDDDDECCRFAIDSNLLLFFFGFGVA
jgi:hypothetical protein